jgi:four helix bundle protein
MAMPKPFDIRERAFLFACDVVSCYPAERLDPKTQRIWLQLVAAGTSGGAHLEEANAASSRAHFVTLNRGALRELSEAHYWIRLIEATQLSGWQRAAGLKSEASELVAIVTTIVKKAASKQRGGSRPGD